MYFLDHVTVCLFVCLFVYRRTEQQELDIFRRLDAVLLQVLLDHLAPGSGGPLLS